MAKPDSLWGSTVADFRDAILSHSAPGCGATAAVSADLGLALVLKGLKVSQARGQDAGRVALLERGDALLGELAGFVDRDAVALENYLEAAHLPHHDAAASSRRQRALNAAAAEANEVPLEAARACLAALKLAVSALPLAARDLRSDIVAGGFLLHSGLSSILLNIDANLPGLEDGKARDRAAHERRSLQTEADQKLQWLKDQGVGTTAGLGS